MSTPEPGPVADATAAEIRQQIAEAQAEYEYAARLAETEQRWREYLADLDGVDGPELEAEP